MWSIENYTKLPEKKVGYLRIFRDGKPVADVFPFAAGQDPDRVICDANWLVDAALAVEEQSQESK